MQTFDKSAITVKYLSEKNKVRRIKINSRRSMLLPLEFFAVKRGNGGTTWQIPRYKYSANNQRDLWAFKEDGIFKNNIFYLIL